MAVAAAGVVLLCLPIARILQPALARVVTLRPRDPDLRPAPAREPVLARH